MIKRESSYDLLRCLAVLGVIMIHITVERFFSFSNDLRSWGLIGLNDISRVAVPMFIFLSGLMISHSKKELKYVAFLKKKFIKIILPYLVVSTLYVLLMTLYYKQDFSIVTYLKQLLLGTSATHLYFIPIITQLFILTPIILYLSKSKIAIAVLMVLSGLSVLFVAGLYMDRIFIKYLAFYLLGLNYHKIKLNNLFKMLLLGINIITLSLSVVIAFNLYALGAYIPYTMDALWFVNGLLTPLSLLMILKHINFNGLNKIAEVVSKNSYWIYLIHPLVILILFRIDFIANIHLSLIYILVCLISFIISYVINYVINIIKKNVLNGYKKDIQSKRTA